MTKKKAGITRIETGVRNLDEMFHGGPPILDDKIRQQTRRLVLDSVSQMLKDGTVPEDLRQLLHALVVRFKSHGVTSILTLESSSMYSTDTVTEQGYSPITDNILMLRYQQVPGEIRPTLAIVKTRGSSHDWGTYNFSITKGGIRIGKRVDGGVVSLNKSSRPRKRAKSRRER